MARSITGGGAVVLWLALATPALASTVAMVRTDAAVSVAADSEQTTKRSDGQDFTTLICKLYRVKQTFFAITGLSTGLNVDLPNVIAGSLRKHQSPVSALDSSEEFIISMLDSHMNFLSQKSPLLYNEVRPKNGPAISSVLMIFIENGVPLLAADDFGSDPRSDFRHNQIVQRIRCPGTCRRPDYNVVIGGTNELAKQRMNEGNFPKTNLVDLVSFFVQVEIDAKVAGVAGPIDIVQLTPSTPPLIRAKPGCPIDLTQGSSSGM